jgi:hypothetical protein
MSEADSKAVVLNKRFFFIMKLVELGTVRTLHPPPDEFNLKIAPAKIPYFFYPNPLSCMRK